MTFILPSFGASAIAAVPGGGGGGGWNGNAYSVDFDGSNDYMDAGNVTALNSVANASFSFWYKTSGTGIVTLIGDASKGLSAYQYNDGNMYIHSFVGGSSHSISKPTSGVWHHIACTFEASASKAYLDGSLVSTVDHGDTTASTCGNDFSIGRLTGYSNQISGQKLVDEVALFTSTLSASQITNIYRGEDDGGSGGTNGVPGDLDTFNPVGWWRMGDGSDGSGNADGTLVNIGGTNFPQIYNVATDGSGNRITGIDGSLTNGPTFHDLSTAPDSIYVA